MSSSSGTPGEIENLSLCEQGNSTVAEQKQDSCNGNTDDEYFYDEYAVCSDMLHDRNVNMFHRDATRYHVPRVQAATVPNLSSQGGSTEQKPAARTEQKEQ